MVKSKEVAEIEIGYLLPAAVWATLNSLCALVSNVALVTTLIASLIARIDWIGLNTLIVRITAFIRFLFLNICAALSNMIDLSACVSLITTLHEQG